MATQTILILVLVVLVSSYFFIRFYNLYDKLLIENNILLREIDVHKINVEYYIDLIDKKQKIMDLLLNKVEYLEKDNSIKNNTRSDLMNKYKIISDDFINIKKEFEKEKDFKNQKLDFSDPIYNKKLKSIITQILNVHKKQGFKPKEECLFNFVINNSQYINE